MVTPPSTRFFPSLSPNQHQCLSRYVQLLAKANQEINLISRKDIGNVWERHIFPSLAFIHTQRFTGRETILDVGSGGGLPGIPLAIAWPDASITLLDSILRKVRILERFIEALKLSNVRVLHQRIERHKEKYDAVIGRAVMDFRKFIILTRNNIAPSSFSSAAGQWYLSGGDPYTYQQQWANLTVYPIHQWLPIPHLETKLLLHVKS